MNATAETYQCPRHGAYTAERRQYAMREDVECRQCVADARMQESAWRASWARWRRAGACGLPSRFQRATLDTWSAQTPLQAAAKSIASDWCDRFDAAGHAATGLTLTGPPGVGKTHMAAGMLWRALQRTEAHAVYAQWPETLRALKASIARHDREGDELLDRLKGADLLVLDELGVKTASEYDATVLFELIDYRYGEELPTMVCTNAPIDTLAPMVGERVVDRLREMNEVVHLQGSSRRVGVREPRCGPLPIERPAESITLSWCLAGKDVQRVVTIGRPKEPKREPQPYERAPLPLFAPESRR